MTRGRSSKSVTTSLACLAVLGAMGGGLYVRHTQELGSRPTLLAESGSALLASREPIAEVSEGEYFLKLVELLRQEFVDPDQLSDGEKLASGAVRGMIESLNDGNAQFLTVAQMRAYQSALKGEIEGVGVDLQYRLEPDVQKRLDAGQPAEDAASLIPNLVVSFVAPGSPAARAGLRPGDRVDAVDGRWVLNGRPLREFRQLQRQVTEGKAKPDQVRRRAEELDRQYSEGLVPPSARDKLKLGQSGAVKVRYERDGQLREADLTRTLTRVPAVEREGDVIRLRFLAGAERELPGALPASGPVTLDLRDSGPGDFETMRRSLAVLLPSGTYGWLSTERSTPPQALSITGTGTARSFRLLVNRHVRGAAEAFAVAMKASGRVTLEGGPMANEPFLIEARRLQDGSGYLIPVARVTSTKPAPKPAAGKATAGKVSR